jgi:cysteinyl-tRNA synthetase
MSEISTGIKIFDTQSRTNKEITLSNGEYARMYCCGPTVYRDAHVGNLRTFLLSDLIAKLIIINGFKVKVIQNITDVGHMGEDFEGNEVGDDKVVAEAKKEKIDPFIIARKYEDLFHQDLARLNIAPAEVYPRASEEIEGMQELISGLIKSSHAYVGSDKSVYFDAQTFSSYGAISGNKLDSLKPGHKYEFKDDGAKKFHADWALWKAAGERTTMVWDSPWGSGFPGWHIECSSMSMHYLNKKVDVHVGGIDLRFPHHENERAQSNAASGDEVVNHWVHGEHLLFEGRKMSKSAGNVVLVQDIIDRGFDPLAVRLCFLENRYRSQMDLSWDSIAAADSTIKRWRRKYQEWRQVQDGHVENSSANEFVADVITDLNEDLDTPRAIVKLRALERDESISAITKANIFEKLDEFFSLGVTRSDQKIVLSDDVQKLLDSRSKARQDKDFALSDQLRDELALRKIKVIDSVQGQSWEVIP